MKAKGFLLSAVMAFAISAPANAGPLDAMFGGLFDTSSGFGLESNGVAFSNALYNGYTGLSASRTDSYDLLDGEYFNHKARTAARRSTVDPDDPADRELSELDTAVFAAALDRLRTSYDRGGRYEAPADAADAQVNYDCWIEATEAGRSGDAEACKAAFEAAMGRVEAAANYGLTEQVLEVVVAETITPAPAMAAPDRFVINFGFDRSTVDAAGEAIVDEAVSAGSTSGEYAVTGHADRAGRADYNMALSLRRANAVRNALVSRGVSASNISVAGRGEAENAVPTADGVREPANRRVEIIIQ